MIEVPMYIRIDPADAEALRNLATIRRALGGMVWPIDIVVKRWEEMCRDRALNAAHIEKARKQATDELEIDANPPVSIADDGVWVGAWVWVANDDTQENTNG